MPVIPGTVVSIYFCVIIHNLMEPEIFTREVVAVFIARVFLGFLFFFQGADAVFKITPAGVMRAIEQPLRERGVPRFFIGAGVYFTSYTELIAGLFLITGFLKYYALYLLGLDLIVASLVFGMIKPMWDMQFVFPRLVLLLFLLLVPAEWDVLSGDYLWAPTEFVSLINK
jgi:putative oxidoreductase